ncbi:DEAD/DEAH box helicase [Demequina rhizosphaerae]|uniref:DEAD/DEAH box helicase n=1 Tax=Demequina rhizosphaerae TaxID=1638985 RepID=UPI0009E2D4E6|nr:DEAD/DEAH box helicase [Demequina rhizosphaerae]
MTETHASVQTPDKTFADFDVDPRIVEALAEKGITTPFPIQAMTLPVALSGHDIIGQAKTGTGKTLGFGIPALQRTAAPGEPAYEGLGDSQGKPQALIVAPTRELAVQVANDLETASRKRAVRIVQIYGGRAYEPQIEALQKGVDVVVGTPGRMIDLLNQGHLDLRFIKTVVLDEADEMLDLGFLPDVEKLLAATPASRHTMLFSATMPGAVVALARRYMTQPTHIRAADPDDDGATVKAIKQVVYRAHALDKVEVLARMLQANGRGLTVVFARTKRTAAKVSDELRDRGFAAGAIHGDLGQGAREQALRAFRTGKIDILVATDVAARGIDVDDVTHVVNYQCPEDEKTYLHRIGRTGRAGKTGTAVTFVDWDDIPRWSLIDKALDLGYPEPQETYSTSPHLFDDLDIPEGTKGRLPKEARTRAGLEAETLEDLGETGKHAGGSGAGGRGQGGRGQGGRGQGGRGGSGSGEGSGEGRSGGGRNRRRRGGSGSGQGGSGEGAPREPRAEGGSGSGQGGSEGGESKPRRSRNRRRRRSGGSGSGEGAPQAQPAAE